MGKMIVDVNKLNQALELTERILASALRSDWEVVNELQLEHGRQIKALFAEAKSCTSEERECLVKISALTNQAVTLVEQNKADIAEQLRQLKKSEAGQKAYLQQQFPV